MNKQDLIHLIDLFLEERVESDGGWAPISGDDLMELGEIIRHLIRLKWGPDCDGDYPIDFRLADRNNERFISPVTIGYAPPDEQTVSDLLARSGALTELLSTINSLSNEAEKIVRQAQYAHVWMEKGA